MNAPESTLALSARGRVLTRFVLFLSGFSALAYEVVWMRLLSQAVGSTVFAVTAVLFVFMAGLGAGGLWWGRRADRWSPPEALRAYGWMQLAAAAFACAAPALLDASQHAYVALYRRLHPGFGLLMAMRVAVSALILLPPTFLLGGSLPAACRWAAPGADGFGEETAGLYAANTLGGLAGCLVAGLAWIEAFGLRGASYYAAALGAAAGAIAWAWSRPAALGPRPAPRTETNAAAAAPPAAFAATAAAAVSGFAGMGYEVLWTRAYLFFMGATVYAFAVVLAAFLCGLALGAHTLGRWAGRGRRPGLWLGLALWGVGAWACGSMTVLCGVFRARGPSAALFEGASLAPVSDGLLAAAAGLLVPTMLMGAALPLAMAWHRSRSGSTGRAVGAAAGANALASALGPAVTGFALIPLLGVDRSVAVLACLNVAAGAAVVAMHRRRAAAAALACAGLAAVAWAARAAPFLAYAKERALGRVLSIEEGPDSTVTVSEWKGRPLLSIDGMPMASSDRGMRWRAHLPMMLHPAPRNALVVGFGTGTTAGVAAARYPPARVDVVELSRTVVRAARFFKAGNHDVLHLPRVRVLVEDARQYVACTDQQYDVIIVDAPHPFAARAAALFGREFYEACRERLAPGGVFFQWIPLYLEPAADLRAMVRTFLAVFPQATMWGGDDINMVAVRGRLRVSMARLNRLLARPGFRADLPDKPYDGAAWFLSKVFLMGPEGARRFAGSGPIITDDRPFIEFTIPRGLRSKGPEGRLITWSEIERFRTPATPYLEP